jgi:alkylhydroperoxidase family enzyme
VAETLAGACGDAPVSAKMRALLEIASLVRVDGRLVSEEAVAEARAQGATDREIHDTVLIAAAFCMFNRYVDGLATDVPGDQDQYAMSAAHLVKHGYQMPR